MVNQFNILYNGIRDTSKYPVEKLMTDLYEPQYKAKDMKNIFPSIDNDEGVGNCPYCAISGCGLKIEKSVEN